MTVRRGAVSILGVVALSAAILGVQPAAVLAAATWHYPSDECPTSGDHGLQDCIDAAGSGDTIVLTNEVTPDGGVTIAKSLTLRAASPSLRPVLRSISIVNGSGPVKVTVEDVRVVNRLRVSFVTHPGSAVTLRRVEVGKGAVDPAGVSFDTQVAASFTLEQSYVRTGDSAVQDDALRLFADDPDGPVSIRVVGNRLTTHGNPGSFSGIALTSTGDGSVDASILSNAIWDVGRCVCGGVSGIFVNPSGTAQVDVDLIGNTIELSATDGIGQRNGLTGGGHLTLDVFDNIISHTEGFAIRLASGAPGSFRFRAGHNARYETFGVSLDGQSPGSGNVIANPRYVDPTNGDLRLRADSPLIDRGLVCTPGGTSMVDAAGRHRLAGATVDMGAHERGAGTASGVLRMGTSDRDTLRGTRGRDILCGFAGNDTLCARDDRRDFVDGGAGRDRARTDRTDIRRSIEIATAPSASACKP